MKVKADRYQSYKSEMSEFLKDAGGEIIPVGMYGKRVSLGKGQVTPEEMMEDIREFYDLEGDAGISPQS